MNEHDTVDDTIRRGTDLAKARERFPDIKAYRTATAMYISPWFTANAVTPESADSIVEVGNAGKFLFAVHVGSIYVVEDDDYVQGKGDKTSRGERTATDILARLMSSEATRPAVVAALTQETWDTFVATEKTKDSPRVPPIPRAQMAREYTFPDVYDGILPDGRMALVIVASSDSIHSIDIGPVIFPDDPANYAAIKPFGLWVSKRWVHYFGGHEKTGSISSIIYPSSQSDSPEAVAPATAADVTDNDYLASAIQSFDAVTSELETALRNTGARLRDAERREATYRARAEQAENLCAELRRRVESAEHNVKTLLDKLTTIRAQLPPFSNKETT